MSSRLFERGLSGEFPKGAAVLHTKPALVNKEVLVSLTAKGDKAAE